MPYKLVHNSVYLYMTHIYLYYKKNSKHMYNINSIIKFKNFVL